MNISKIKRIIICSAVFSCTAIFILACNGRTKSPVVARVGNSVLTLDELYKTIPPEYSDFITREQIVNYVKRWIDNTILYHEALRLKLDKDDAVRARLKRMKEDMLCSEIINRNSVPLQDIRVPESAVEQYYNENKAKFIREKGEVKFLQIIVDDAATAWKVRGLITEDNFLSLATQYSKVQAPDLKNVSYVKLENLPPECAQEISTTKINGTSQVVKTTVGYSLFRVLDKQAKGSIRGLDEVRDDITNIIAAKMQNEALEKLISSLRTKMIVEAHLEVISDHAGAEDNKTVTNPVIDTTKQGK